MDKKINLNERIFVAGAHGMAGSAICKSLKNMDMVIQRMVELF